MASFRGRAGFAVDRALFYVTGGVAVAQVGATTRWGWTVGGGVELAVSPKWTVGGEYRYTDFGSRGAAFDIPSGLPAAPIFFTGAGNSRLAVGQVTVRVNYHRN